MKQLPLLQPASLSVSEITRYLRDLLSSDDLLQDVWVQGEVSNLSRPSSGHLYFTLKDNTASLRCVMWKSTAQRLRFALQNGLAVEAHGAISIYERDGQYQLYADVIRPAGEGALYQEFLHLKAQLENEGLFDLERKREIPSFPKRIGIVTSPTGAALQDMLNTLRARFPLAEVIVSPCSVQGDLAPAEIVAAIGRANRAGVDVVIVARGGGSLEDLWAFNDERVVRAIANSPVPVITGVGHETDFTLADFASDLRAPTPTGAAVQATPDCSDLATDLFTLKSLLVNTVLFYVAQQKQEGDSLRQRLERASPSWRIQNERQRVDEWQERCNRAAHHALQLHQIQLRGSANRLLALDPERILRRGYALIQRKDGSLIHAAAQAQAGEIVFAQLWDGALKTRVEEIKPGAWKRENPLLDH